MHVGMQVEGADHVLPLLFHTPDESDSPYFAENLAADEAAAKVGLGLLQLLLLHASHWNVPANWSHGIRS